MTVFSRQTDAPELRCDLTDTHTQTQHRNPPAHARRGCLTIPWLFHECMLPHLATLTVYIYHLPDPDSEPLGSMPDPDRAPL